MCDVVDMSHLYEYLAVSEIHVTGDFALTGSAACCFCGTGTNDSHTTSSMVCAHHRQRGAGNYTSVPGNNSLNPKCEWCEASKIKEDESQNTAVLEKCTGCVARQCAECE